MGETQDLFLVPDSIEDIQNQLTEISEEIRSMGLGIQADRLIHLSCHLKSPQLSKIFNNLMLPNVWPTKKHVYWILQHVSIAAQIIEDLLDDAEITGNTQAIERAKKWKEELGF